MLEFDTDAAFDIEKTSENILSIQVSLDGFSFSVSHPGVHRMLAFKHTPLKISSNAILSRHFEAWAQAENLFQKPFRKTRLIIFTPHFSLIPKMFYGEDLKEAVTHKLLGQGDAAEIAENYIEELKATLVFALPDGFNETAQRFFEGSEIIHPLKLILNNAPETNKNYALSLLFEAQNFYTVLSKQNQVLLVNNFKTAHVTDVVYFALNILQQYEVAQQDAEVFLSGSCTDTENIAAGLLPYFDNISFLKPAAELKNPELAGNSFLRYFLPL